MLLLNDEDDRSGIPPSGGVMSSAESHVKIEIKETECQSSAFPSPALVSSKYFRLGLYIIVVQFNIQCVHIIRGAFSNNSMVSEVLVTAVTTILYSFTVFHCTSFTQMRAHPLNRVTQSLSNYKNILASRQVQYTCM